MCSKVFYTLFNNVVLFEILSFVIIQLVLGMCTYFESLIVTRELIIYGSNMKFNFIHCE